MPFPSVFGSLWTPHRAAAWTALFLFLLTASAYFCGVNAKRALQHAVFIVPFIALWLLSLPARSNESRSGWQKVCLAAAVVGLLLAFIDAALRAFLYQTYSAEPMSTFVLESAANTNLDEALGFLATEWTGALLGTLLSLATLTVALFVMHLASKTSSNNAMASGWRRWFGDSGCCFLRPSVSSAVPNPPCEFTIPLFFGLNGWNPLQACNRSG